VLSMVIRDTGGNFEACSFVCDYEKGLIKALQDEFPKVPHIGCSFHHKQLLRRKAKEFGLSDEVIAELLGENGRFDFLVLITIGIYHRRHIDVHGETNWWFCC
jgi:hypothetical protein